MKKGTKISLIVAGSLVLTGAVLAFISLASVGFDVKKLSTFQGYETTKLEVAGAYSSVYIDESNNDFTVSSSPDSSFHISYSENEVETMTVVDADNQLRISRDDVNNYFHPWYFPTEDKIMDIQVPVNYAGKLVLETSNAAFRIDEICVTSLELSSSNGAILISASTIASFRGETSNNQIAIADCVFAKADLDSSNGKIAVLDSEISQVQASTSSAPIEITDSLFAGPSSFETSNSSISLNGASAAASDLSLSASNGAIDIKKSIFNTLEAETSNAPISVDHLEVNASARLETSNNSISGTVVGSMDAFAIYSSTSNGSNSLPTAKTNGDKTLRAYTSNGNIDVTFVA